MNKTEVILTHQRIDLVTWFRKINKYPVIPVIFLLPIVIFGIFGPFIYPHDPHAADLAMALKPPAWAEGGDVTNLLGTDNFGRDYLSRLIEGARISLIVSLTGVFFAGIIGVLVGLIAGYFRGIVDMILMRIVDIQMSIPPILLVILISAAMGSGPQIIIIAIAIAFWVSYARVIRGEAIMVAQFEYVTQAKITGGSSIRILKRHILPNVINSIMVLATLQLGSAIMVEASVTFLGLGIQPPDTAWGLIIADGRSYMSRAWWIPTFAGICITLTVMGANLLGDWLRDKLDPKLRQI